MSADECACGGTVAMMEPNGEARTLTAGKPPVFIPAGCLIPKCEACGEARLTEKDAVRADAACAGVLFDRIAWLEKENRAMKAALPKKAKP